MDARTFFHHALGLRTIADQVLISGILTAKEEKEKKKAERKPETPVCHLSLLYLKQGRR